MTFSWTPLDDKSKWEWFVLQFCSEAIFQSWYWGEIQRQQGNTVLRFGLYDGSELVSVAQAVHVKAKRGPFLHVRHGPIISNGKHQILSEVVIRLKNEAKKLGCLFLRINPLIADSDENRRMFDSIGLRPAAIHRMDGERCWILDLGNSQEALLSQMRKTTRYEIRRAQQSGVNIFSTADSRYLKDFFTLYAMTSHRHNFVQHAGISQEFSLFSKKRMATLYLARHKKETLASAIIIYYGNQAIYHHGASKHAKVPASHLLQWEAIKEAKNRGMHVYNFWGIAPEDKINHPWRGITLFKKGFGGHEISYIHAHDAPLSPLYIVPRMIETVRRIQKGYD